MIDASDIAPGAPAPVPLPVASALTALSALDARAAELAAEGYEGVVRLDLDERVLPFAGESLRNFIRTRFLYRPRLQPSDWVCQHIFLPAGKNESEPGRVSFEKRPYLRAPLNDIADITVSDIVLVAPTRIGKTFVLRMGVAYCIAAEPSPMKWVDSTEKTGRTVSKTELQPLIEANEILRSLKPKNRNYFTDLSMLFPGAFLSIVGGKSDAQVTGDTARIILGNEVDKWRDATDKEASIAEQVRHRTESFEKQRKHLWSSTPTLENRTIWSYYLRSDRRVFKTICPDCKRAQELIWDKTRVIWDQSAQLAPNKWDLRRVKETARYKCIACGSLWDDDMRHLAIRHKDADWLATAVGEEGWHGYHINGLYGPLESNNVGALAVDFLTARQSGFIADRRDFWNSRMGMPWKEEILSLTVELFSRFQQDYQRGEVPAFVLVERKLPGGGIVKVKFPFTPALAILSFDVQSYGIWWELRAYMWDGTSCLIDHGKVGTFEDIARTQDIYRKLIPTTYVIGDIHYPARRQETLEAIHRYRNRGWYGAEGMEFVDQSMVVPRAHNVYEGGPRQNERICITKFLVSTYQIKVELQNRYVGNINNWFFYSPSPLAATEHDIEEMRDYFKQLTDERQVPRKHKSRTLPELEFRSRNDHNHYFDCEVYNFALFWTLQRRRTAKERAPQPAERREVTVSTQ